MKHKRRTWFVDATFRVVPYMFYQLFTIHTRENVTTVPCAYIVMNVKSTEAYEDVFKAIKKQSKNDPETIHVDFEEAKPLRMYSHVAQSLGATFTGTKLA